MAEFYEIRGRFITVRLKFIEPKPVMPSFELLSEKPTWLTRLRAAISNFFFYQ